jgi:hypothetical protein
METPPWGSPETRGSGMKPNASTASSRFANAVHRDHPGLFEHIGIDRCGRGDLAGVGGRRILADRRAAGLERHDLHAAFRRPLPRSQDAAASSSPSR